MDNTEFVVNQENIIYLQKETAGWILKLTDGNDIILGHEEAEKLITCLPGIRAEPIYPSP